MLFKVMGLSGAIGIGLAIFAQHPYDTRENKCMVSVADAISSRPEMVELRAMCVALRRVKKDDLSKGM